jgi:drug/metabolite transporter (DMT)-like permease
LSGNKGLSGWVEAGLFVVSIAVLNLSYFAAQAFGAHAIVFLVYAMLMAAVALLAVAGPGPDLVKIMLTPLSWLVGAGIIGMEAFYYLTLWYVTPAEASVLTRLAIPVSMIMGYSLMGRRPALGAMFGALSVTLGIAWLSASFDPAKAVPGLLLAFTCAIVMTTRTYAAEFHPWNRNAKTVPDKMRFTGAVLLGTSLAGALLVAVLMLISTRGVFGAATWLPSLRDFFHLPTVLVALLVGVCILTAMQYFSFSSVVKIGTENFIAVTAFSPLTTLIAQQIAAAAGVLPPMPVEWQIIPAIAMVTTGVLVIIWAGRAKAAVSRPSVK